LGVFSWARYPCTVGNTRGITAPFSARYPVNVSRNGFVPFGRLGRKKGSRSRPARLAPPSPLVGESCPCRTQCPPPPATYAALYSSGSNVVPRRARPGLAGLRPHTTPRLFGERIFERSLVDWYVHPSCVYTPRHGRYCLEEWSFRGERNCLSMPHPGENTTKGETGEHNQG